MSDVFQPEQVVGGRYRVVRKLGGGGMADVYLCEDLTLGRHVAIKVLLQRYLDDPTFVERFRREAKAAAGLNQQNLVSIYDWGEVDGTYYIVMEYVEGETLKDLIRRRGRLSGNEAVAVTLQLLAAVDFAHRSGIVHRDIKPQNIMLDPDGTAKVMDFGIARAGDSGMTEAGSILGTAQYLAPEQAKGYPVDERSDLYSVGVVPLRDAHRHRAVQGRQRRHRRAQARQRGAGGAGPSWCPGMPYALNQIVLKAMAKDPADRYQSAAEFAPRPARRQGGRPRAGGRLRRRRRAHARDGRGRPGCGRLHLRCSTSRCRRGARSPSGRCPRHRPAARHRRRGRRTLVDDERRQGGHAQRGRPEQGRGRQGSGEGRLQGRASRRSSPTASPLAS